jgi:hypothetical protein
MNDLKNRVCSTTQRYRVAYTGLGDLEDLYTTIDAIQTTIMKGTDGSRET